MKNKEQGKPGILFVLMAIISLMVITTSVIFTILLIQYRTKDLMDSTDARLLTADELTMELLGPDYHNSIVGENSVSKEQFRKIVERNDELCRRLNLQYLWSVLLINDHIVFTSATHSDINDPNSPCASFFEVHRDPNAFTLALESESGPSFSSFKNEWGEGRQVLIARKDSRGRTYIFGASVQLTEYNEMIRRTVITSIEIGIVVLFTAFLMALFLARHFTSPIASLADGAGLMAMGDLDAPLKPTGIQEIQSLANSLDCMRQGLKKHISDLKDSEEKYRLLIENSHDIIYTLTPDGIFTFVSPAWTEVLGHNVTEVIGKSFIPFVHPEDIPQCKTFLQTVIETAQRQDGVEYRVQHIDGSWKWHISSGVPLKDNTGKVIGLEGIARDITVRKHTEMALRESEKRYRELFENSRDGFVIINDKGRFIDANQAYCEMLGYTLEELKEMENFYKITPTYLHDWEKREIWEKRLMKDGYTGIFEKEYIRKDGIIFPVEIQSYNMLDDKGKMTHIWGITRDITERKQAEDALKMANQRLLTVFNSIQSLVYVADMETYEVLFINQYGRNVWGNIEGQKCWESIQIDQTGPCDFCTNKKLVDEKGNLTGIYQWEFQNTRNKRWYDCQDIAIKWIDGRIVRLEIATDITDRKNAEEEGEKLQIQLNQAQKMESVGRLAGGVAHDFNNMLGVILGHIEMALEDIDSKDPLCGNLREIQKAAERSADLTRQLLAFARKQTIAPKVLELNETVEGILKMLRRLIGEDITLTWLPGKNLWPIKFDPSQIDQILANLCVNARDAITDMGKVTIETGNRVFDETYCANHIEFIPGEYVLLAVSDDGCGIDREVKEKLFEPFFTTKEIGKGTGLGLATVYGIVKQNNGFINVYSELDKGTTFSIYLPHHRGKDKQIKKEVITEPYPHGEETILLVEDEATILDMARRMLKRLGYTVLTASTTEEALSLAESYKQDIQLLMTDIVMPKMNGKELSNKIHSLFPNIKCLFMSGYTADVIAYHGIIDEGINFIQKPFSMKEVAAKVREILDNK